MSQHPLPYRLRSLFDKTSVNSILLGLSGGADSVALLRILLECGANVRAIHCNFHLRGDESMRDEAFCTRLCQKLGVSLEIRGFDVQEYRESEGVSVEKACRDLRYAFFRKRLKEGGYDRIAVAHNRDDQAETVLMNLFRGAGVRGLSAMQPDTGEIIRPLLDVSRAEITAYLEAIGQDYITDSTNLESDYRRNFIRNELLPLVETRWPAAKRKIAETAEIMRGQLEANEFFTRNLRQEDTDMLPSGHMADYPSKKWAVREFVTGAGGSEEIAEEITRSLSSSQQVTGKWWRINARTRITAERDGLHIIRATDGDPQTEVQTESHPMDGTLMERIRKAPLTELWLPLLPEEVEFRIWQKGDRIEPLGMKGSRLVSDIIRDAKLTTAEKEHVTVAVERATGQLLWVNGLKRSRQRLLSTNDATAYRYILKESD